MDLYVCKTCRYLLTLYLVISCSAQLTLVSAQVSTTSTTESTTTQQQTTATCSYLYIYRTVYRILDIVYTANYGITTSSEYLQLVSDLQVWSRVAYDTGGFACLPFATTFVFTPGSVVVNSVLELNVPLTAENITQLTIDSAGTFPVGTLDTENITVIDLSATTTTQPTTTETTTETTTQIITTTTTEPVTTTQPYIIDLYTFGPDAGDIDVACGEQLCYSKETKTNLLNFQGFNTRRYQISSNGYIKLGKATFEKRQPSPWASLLSSSEKANAAKQGLAIIAPFWVDNDLLLSENGSSCYQEYDINDKYDSKKTADEINRLETVLARADADVVRYGGVASFSSTWVLVVTWKNLLPRNNYDSAKDQPNTVQAIIASEGLYLRTYALFLYKQTGWNSFDNLRNSMVGYYVLAENDNQETLEKSFTSFYSFTTQAFNLDSINGNTGEPGKWLLEVGSASGDINYEQKCVDWYAAEKASAAQDIADLYLETRSCPCDVISNKNDKKWRFDKIQNGIDPTRYCYYENAPKGQSAQECCYDEEGDGSLITSEAEGRAGNFMKFKPKLAVSHMNEDINPKLWCCIYSSAYCEQFYELRPIDKCGDYVPPIVAWFYGDPHITSLDGSDFTFNGLGEYTMLATRGGNFTILCRTHRPMDDAGVPLNATAFGAFAAREALSDPVHVQVNAQMTAFEVFVNSGNVTDWFSAAADDDVYEGDGVTLVKENANSIVLSYAVTGFTLEISLQSGGILDITVYTPEEFRGLTSGLVGVFNGDPNDDLTAFDGTVLPISSSESDIFYNFGQTWKVKKATDSFLYYSGGETFLSYSNQDFTPVFTDVLLTTVEPAALNTIQTDCNNNQQCVFDTIVTNNAVVGQETLLFDDKTTITAEELVNNRPVMTGDDFWNVTAFQSQTYTVTVTDADGDATILYSQTDPLPTGATFDNTTGILSWVPSSMNPVEFTFGARDVRGGVAASLTIVVRFCNCSEQGSCLFGQQLDASTATAFRVVECACDTGWEGDQCQNDFDGCGTNPCLGFENCVDYTPADELTNGVAYDCTGCPSGYLEELVGTRLECVDINECDQSPAVCDQDCINVPGTYKCKCLPNYIRDDANNTCTDIDECAALTDGCQQVCNNLPGTFECSCLPNFDLNADNTTCTDTLNTCERAGLNCSAGCTNDTDTGVVTCYCPSGYEIGADLETCQDVDECSDAMLNQCSQQENCQNEVGTFTCSCDVGYLLQANGRTCEPCEDGRWGQDCLNECTCGVDTVCNITYGCETCIAGFSGGSCDVDIDECLQTPCSSDMGDVFTCVNSPGSFRCECDAGYENSAATVCVEIDECESNPCTNNGQCNDFLNAYNCTCATGYDGTHCENDIDECVSSPCQNGGTCVDRVGLYRCECGALYTGVNCEIEIVLPTEAPATTTTGLPDTTPEKPETTTTEKPETTTTETPETTTAKPTLCTSVTPILNYTIRYEIQGRFTIPDRLYRPEYDDVNSFAYRELFVEIFPQLERIFGCDEQIKEFFIGIGALSFSAGSIVNNFVLSASEPLDVTIVQSVLNEAYAKGLLTFTIDPNSTVFSLVTIDGPSGLPQWALILIIVCCVLALVLTVVVVLCCRGFYSRARSRFTRSEMSSDETESSSGESAFKPFTFPRPGLLVWQDGESMNKLPDNGQNMHRGRDEARMRVIRSAVDRAPPIDWPRIRQFAAVRRSGGVDNAGYGVPGPSEGQWGGGLHRGPAPYVPAAPRSQRYNLTGQGYGAVTGQGYGGMTGQNYGGMTGQGYGGMTGQGYGAAFSGLYGGHMNDGFAADNVAGPSRPRAPPAIIPGEWGWETSSDT